MSMALSLPSTRRLVMGAVLLLLAATLLSGAAQAGPNADGNHVHIYVVGGSRSCNSPGTPPMSEPGTTVTVGFCAQNALGQGQSGQSVSWSVQGASIVTQDGQTDANGEARITVQRDSAGQAVVTGTWVEENKSASITVTWGVAPPPTHHIHLLTAMGAGLHPCHTSSDNPPDNATAASTANRTVGTTQTVYACVHDSNHGGVDGRAVTLDPGNLGSASAPTLRQISEGGRVTFTYTSPTAGKTQSSARADGKVSPNKMTITWHRDTDHVHAFVQGAGGCESQTDPVSVEVGVEATIVACVHGEADDGIPDSRSSPSTGTGAPRVVGWSYEGDVGSMSTSADSSRTDVNGQARATVRSNEEGQATITAIQGSKTDSVTVNYVRTAAPPPPPAAEAKSGPDASSWAPGRLDLFAAGSEGQLIHRWYDGSWSLWEDLAGQLTADPTAVSWGNNRLDVFVRGTDGGMWHRWWDGSGWLGYESLGGQLVGGPDAASWQAGRLDVFARGTDNALWHTWYDGTWHGWESLGGVITSDPTAVSWEPNRLDVFARGTDNAIWQISYDGTSWSGWSSRGGTATSGPDVSSWAPGRLDLFVRGTDNAIWHTWYDGTWHGYQSIGGAATSDPGAVSWASNRIDLFVRGTNNAIWHAWWDGRSWNGYESLGAR